MRARLELYRNGDLVDMAALNQALARLSITALQNQSAYLVVGAGLQLHLQWVAAGERKTDIVSFCVPLPQEEPTHEELLTVFELCRYWGTMSADKIEALDLAEQHMFGRLAAALETLEYGTVIALDDSVAFLHGKAQGHRLLGSHGLAAMAEYVRDNLWRKAV